MRKILTILLMCAIWSTTLNAYRLPTAWTLGGGLAYDSVRVTAYRAVAGSATLTNEVDTSFVGAGTDGSFALFVDSLVNYTVRYMYFSGTDTFREFSYGNTPIDYEMYVRANLAAGVTAAGVADAVWDEIIGGAHEISGSSGALVLEDNTTLLNGVWLRARGTDADTSFSALQTKVQAIMDSLAGQSWAATGSASSGCPDSVGNAWTIVAWDSVNDVAVPNAVVTLKATAASVTSLAQAKSGFTFTAANGTYYVAIEANNVTFPIRSFAISTSRTDTINGGGFTVLTPSAPNLCALQGYIKDLNNNPIAGALVTFTLSSSLDTLRYGGSEFTTGSKQVYTSSTGYFSTELVPNALLDANSFYIYKVAKSGVMGLPKERKIVVPNTGSADIDDL